MLQARITDDETPKAKPVIQPVVPNGKSLVSPPRRFERPDIERHGVWLLPRFNTAFPHLNNQQAMSFMVNVLYSNEFMFLYQDHGVALAQVMNEHTLQPEPMIWERFVFLENAENPRHVEEGATFYDEFVLWAKRKQIVTLVIDQCTDVPREVIKQRMPGRVLSQEHWIVKV